MGYWKWLIRNIARLIVTLPFVMLAFLKSIFKDFKRLMLTPEILGVFGAIWLIIGVLARFGLRSELVDPFIWVQIMRVTTGFIVGGFLVLTYAIYRAGGLFKE